MKKILLVEGNLKEANQEFTENGIKTHTESLQESISYYTNSLEIESVNPSSDKDIFDKVKDLNKYDEILLVGSGKGIVSVKTIKQIGWKRKNLKTFKVLSKYYKSITKKCRLHKF